MRPIRATMEVAWRSHENLESGQVPNFINVALSGLQSDWVGLSRSDYLQHKNHLNAIKNNHCNTLDANNVDLVPPEEPKNRTICVEATRGPDVDESQPKCPNESDSSAGSKFSHCIVGKLELAMVLIANKYGHSFAVFRSLQQETGLSLPGSNSIPHNPRDYLPPKPSIAVRKVLPR